MTNRHISMVRPEDIPAIDFLVNSAYRGDSARIGWTHEADLLNGSRVDADIIAQLVADPNITLLKYTEDGQIIGCVCLEKREDHVYLGMLTVNPSLQAKGIGKALLEAAESYAPVLGCNTIEMTVITVREELIAWYIRRGYRNTGKIKDFPTGDTRFGIPVTRLEFVVLEKQL
ncbi:GNAT family N-acetyltransferase [Chitinophaga sp. S165]|uniref:GNAT family N-acetyltransferase n=1 Tax=Chitinophaga sp. S165 TaxID=2135462 RepID=UPI001E603A56|nr:GNAT family N-acetyltransferase [Chitinophaga sp. S165]